MEHLVKRIKDLRNQKGLSHEYVAFKLKISQAAYCKIEKNYTKITVERLFQIAEILETNVSELLLTNSCTVTQTNNANMPSYLEQMAHFCHNCKEQNQKMLALFEGRLKELDKLIEILQQKLSTST